MQTARNNNLPKQCNIYKLFILIIIDGKNDIGENFSSFSISSIKSSCSFSICNIKIIIKNGRSNAKCATFATVQETGRSSKKQIKENINFEI